MATLTVQMTDLDANDNDNDDNNGNTDDLKINDPQKLQSYVSISNTMIGDDIDENPIANLKLLDNDYTLVIHQNDYFEKCIFTSIPPPSWRYKKPPSSIMQRGLTANTLHELLQEINEISHKSFSSSDNLLIRVLPIIPLLLLIIGFILIVLSIINNSTPEINKAQTGSILFGIGLILGCISCFMAQKQRKISINESIQNVSEYIQNDLTKKWKDQSITFKFQKTKSLTVMQFSGRNDDDLEDNMDIDDDDDDDNYNLKSPLDKKTNTKDPRLYEFTYYNIIITAIPIDDVKNLQNKLLSVN